MEPAATPHDASETPRLCYAMAYFVLPQYLADKRERLLEVLNMGTKAGSGFLYVATCQMNDVEPRDEVVSEFQLHTEKPNDTTTYFVIQYPTPDKVDLLDLPESELAEAMQNTILAPYFSAVVQRGEAPLEYFVLGQAPDGHTTLRTVTQAANTSLGPGCMPDLDSFLAMLDYRS